MTERGAPVDGTPTVYFARSVSLDGFIDGPDGGLDWHRVDDELFEHFLDLDRKAGWHVYGRRLYETMTFWEAPDLDIVRRSSTPDPGGRTGRSIGHTASPVRSDAARGSRRPADRRTSRRPTTNPHVSSEEPHVDRS